MNDQSQPQQIAIPDVTLTSQEVERILNQLNNSIIFAKSQDGTMRPFIDPMPISNIIGAAIQRSVQGAMQ